MESEALRISFQSITVYAPDFVVTLGGKVGAKPRKNVNGIVIYF